MAVIFSPLKPVTDDELRVLAERNPGYKFERNAKGELIVTPTGSESSRASAETLGQLRDWNRRAARGVVFDSSGGFRLPDGSVFAPDASWVRRDRWDALSREQREEFAPLCPDVVFEVRSKPDRLHDLREKMLAYIANGAHVAVLIDPYERTVEVFRPNRETVIHQSPSPIAFDPELGGFVLELDPIFTV
jgi:Uma2 family endonuclease